MKNLIYCPFDLSLYVSILNTKDKDASIVPGKQPVEQGSPDIAYMGVARRAGGIADSHQYLRLC
jgi:hypothetical protein